MFDFGLLFLDLKSIDSPATKCRKVDVRLRSLAITKMRLQQPGRKWLEIGFGCLHNAGLLLWMGMERVGRVLADAGTCVYVGEGRVV
ncbi:MAG: hypothetical protein HQL53_01630 [Magnetococcales bacterium]|nr:hypothetical protein [Magnetococcales bacterium]